ncbi:MAG TPA: ATP-binding protein [Myxococcales bacterium]|jgi:signal transduction histidine kinase
MSTTIPFSGLAPDARTVRGGGELSTFSLAAAIRMGREIRKSSQGASSLGDAATAVVNAVNALEQDGRPACVLVRAFALRRDGHVELLATRGLEPQWNDVAEPVPEVDPAPLLDELRSELRHLATASLYEEKRPLTSWGVRSVTGFAAHITSDFSFAVVAWARAVSERAAVRWFELVALYARLALVEVIEQRLADAESDRRLRRDPNERRLRDEALEGLLAVQEAHILDVLSEWPRRLNEVRLAAQLSADANARKLEEHNRNLQRTQRAMVNVVEDLREARNSLAGKVEERTRELALRNRELEDFVYIASHDLQEPLRTVAGYLQMIERRYASKLDQDADDFIRFAIEGAQRMQALIESLLHYSRVSTKDKHFEWLLLDEPLDVALQNLALRVEETRARIDRTPLPRVRADRTQMVQLFQNLLSNALKFAGDKPPSIHIAASLEGQSCVLTVRDQGIGFEQKFADRIFKIFRRLRRDTPGTGVGLAVCKKIAERHGGTIEAQSSPGQGATFTLRIPISSDP